MSNHPETPYDSRENTIDSLGFKIVEGLEEEHIDQLIMYSNTDPKVMANTSDPRRFKDRAAFDKWLKKDGVVKRFPYSLVDDEGKLVGIVWFGEGDFPLRQDELKPDYVNLETEYYGITFALRTYPGARGRHLAKEFMSKALSAYLKSEAYKKASDKGKGGIWLETSVGNEGAVATYKSYEQVSDPDEKGRIVMVLDPAKNKLLS
jgi:hypothetical protein